MSRTLCAIALLLAVGACNRGPAANGAGNGSANASLAGNAAVAAPAPAAPATNVSVNAAASASEEGDVMADRERGPRPSAEEERTQGCAGEIGLPAARRLVEQCTDVSPATRPPCNTANNCALIREEIVRGCGFLKEDAPAFCKEAG
jgi:hypothetical protein